MKNIHIRAIGSPSEAWQKAAAETYLTRLKPYAKVEIDERPEGHKGSAKPDATRAKAAEAQALLKAHKSDAFVIALDETGKEYSSSAFSKQLELWSEGGRPFVFLIGGSWGLSDEVRDKADALLSLGKMTLPHGLARIVLLEQLYRAEAIARGKEYHK
jgi:23S rRNA (pseudouridine1915-N3)-methyltransferase